MDMEYRTLSLEKLKQITRDMETFRQSLRLMADEVQKKHGGEYKMPEDEYIYLWKFYNALEHEANEKVVSMIATYSMAKAAREILGEEKT